MKKITRIQKGWIKVLTENGGWSNCKIKAITRLDFYVGKDYSPMTYAIAIYADGGAAIHVWYTDSEFEFAKSDYSTLENIILTGDFTI